ncbi:hypothetical protein B0T18DRAFT_390323 [Schizothecium vesticola]|uniref:Uncharacterized protein n=1 Tax=Schizothecium vesticola TaxID=314040 RepID=A0AA40EUF7_9PEZI|nr:hypothetical protein B0T18DRAFT_390323 [Schizothecium vesticola]
MCLRYLNTEWACTATKCMLLRIEDEIPGSMPVQTVTKHRRSATVRSQQIPPAPAIENRHSPDCTGGTTDVATVHTIDPAYVSYHKRRERDMKWHLHRKWWVRSVGYIKKLGPKFQGNWWSMTKDAFAKEGAPTYIEVMKELLELLDGFWQILMDDWTEKHPVQQKPEGGERRQKRKRADPRGMGDLAPTTTTTTMTATATTTATMATTTNTTQRSRARMTGTD